MNLQELGLKYGTDKSRHEFKNSTYLNVYDRYLNHKKNDVKIVVEIGILNGSSLKMWKEYFPNANIYGIDINPDCKKFEEDRIKILIGDQNDDNFLNIVKNELPKIDFLIDDGSHITKHQIKTYDYLWENMTSGGTYIIEDLANSYEEFNGDLDLRIHWPGMNLNKPNDPLRNKRSDLDDWIKEKVKKLDLRDENSPICSIHHHPMSLVFEFC